MQKQFLIKICGITDVDTATAVVNAGASLIGLMMYSGSKRYINLTKAKEIASAVKTAGGVPVAVFVDYDASEMLSICQQMGVNVVQLHGIKSKQSHHSLPESFTRIYVLQIDNNGVILNEDAQSLNKLNSERDLLLFDSTEPGTGKAFPWNQFENPSAMPFLLAGGLNVKNVKQAIQIVKPDGVDVSSGVETMPGKKDLTLIKKFISECKAIFL